MGLIGSEKIWRLFSLRKTEMEEAKESNIFPPLIFVEKCKDFWTLWKF